MLVNYDSLHKSFTDQENAFALKQLNKQERINSFLHANNKLECSNSYSHFRYSGERFTFKRGLKTNMYVEANLSTSFRENKNIINLGLEQLPEDLAYRILNEIYKYIDQGE